MSPEPAEHEAGATASTHALHRLSRTLAARIWTPYVLLAYAVFVLLLAIFGVLTPWQTVARMATMHQFVIAYVLAFVHLLFCTILFFAVVRQRTSLDVPAAEDWHPVAAIDRGRIRHDARSAGLRVSERAGTLVLHRHRWTAAGTIVFHAALLLLPLVWLLSALTRFEGNAWVIEGHRFGGAREEYVQVEPEEAFARRAPVLDFMVESIDATFWGDRLFFTDLRAVFTTSEGAHLATLPAPARLGGARISIRGFNYTPSFELRAPDGRVVERGDLNLRLFPPGSEDSFRVPGLPHRFWMRLHPARQGYDLGDPRLHLAVTRGRRLVAQGWLRPGEPLIFEGYQVSFPVVHRAGDILVHRDASYPLLWIALVLALAGMLVRVVFPGVRIWIRHDGDQALALLRADPFAGARAERLLASWRAS